MGEKQPRSVVLIADDNPLARQAYRDVLEGLGHRIITVDDGQKAVSCAISDSPDAIILDVNMPVLNGYDATRTIHGNPKTRSIPIVIISGRKDVTARIKALEAGAVDYLTKPVHTEELRARIDSLLRVKAYNDFMFGYQEKLKGELANKTEQLWQSLESFSRFVPKEFLQHLGRDNITQVQLGDQALRELAILFSDIRSFTTLSEKMTPQQNFNFLNSYLKRMDPFIWSNHGFIDKYIGDSIMALFPEGEESALKAAIQMMEYLPVYNAQRRSFRYDPINIGIGVHSGPVMLGTIGHERFMQGTVISSSVNLASRLEGLTKIYGVQIVASSNIIFGLADPTQYCYRFIDKIAMRGMSEPTPVFEVFDANPKDQKAQKLATHDAFEQAVYDYHNGDFERASERFREIEDQEHRDGCVTVYRKRCEHALRSEV